MTLNIKLALFCTTFYSERVQLCPISKCRKNSRIPMHMTPKSNQLFLVTRSITSKNFAKTHLQLLLVILYTNRRTKQPTDRGQNITTITITYLSYLRSRSSVKQTIDIKHCSHRPLNLYVLDFLP